MHGANMRSSQTKRFRLVVCCSADLGGTSLAATFARRAGKPTKGYEGDVFNNLPTVMAYGESRPGLSAMDAFVRGNYEIIKRVRSTSRLVTRDANGDEVTHFGHRSVTFQPG